MSHPKISRIEFRPGFRERTQCSYWDYYVDDHRLADVFKIGDFIPPFGWLSPDVEDGFANMLLRKRESDLKPARIPLFVCPECADYGCGVFTCEVTRNGEHIEWRNFAMQNNYEEGLWQDEAERWTWLNFDATEYYRAFERFLSKADRRRK